jgi:Sec-independent protein translocase protein TatA
MEFLGVGPTELLFIIIIALIVLGPKDLAKTGSTVGKWLNSLIQSDGWKAIRKTSDELRRLPTQLMREDNLKNFLNPDDLLQQAEDKKRDAWTGQPGGSSAQPRTDPSASLQTDLAADPKNDNTIHPPVALDKPPAQTVKPARKKSAATARKKSPAAKKKEDKPARKPTPRKKPNA